MPSDGVNTYTYTNNKLTSVNNGTNQITYQYDGLGALAGQTVDGQVTHYVLDQAAGLTQVLEDGTSTYLYGNDLLAQQNGTDTEYYFGDALNSVRQLTEQLVTDKEI